MSLKIPYFETKKELFNFLIDNKEQLIAQKKSEIKKADGYAFNNVFYDTKEKAYKANIPIIGEIPELKVRAIINTTNIMDSHLDVHIPGLWNKSIRENKMIMHVREHKSNDFDYIISDGDMLNVFTKKYSWGEIGFNYEGETEALVFDSTIKAINESPRNPYMFDQYSKGFVKNHSVGMIYVKLIMCINDKDYGAQFEAWEKYYPMVSNKEMAEESGFFWAVKEAKIIEGSAVPLGSNIATPTFDNNLKTKVEPPQGTQQNNNQKPLQSTIDLGKLINNLK